MCNIVAIFYISKFILIVLVETLSVISRCATVWVDNILTLFSTNILYKCSVGGKHLTIFFLLTFYYFFATAVWVDDMFMGTALLAAWSRISGEVEHLQYAARQVPDMKCSQM